MYLRNTRNEVKDLIERVNELDNENKMKYIIYIFNLWDNDQINSLNEINPYLLDDSIEINIFNPKPSAIGIAPLSSTIGTILIKKTNKYFTIIGKLAII